MCMNLLRDAESLSESVLMSELVTVILTFHRDTVTFGVEFYLPIRAGDSLNLPAPTQVLPAPGRWAILNVEP